LVKEQDDVIVRRDPLANLDGVSILIDARANGVRRTGRMDDLLIGLAFEGALNPKKVLLSFLPGARTAYQMTRNTMAPPKIDKLVMRISIIT
jgi:hypothetical protein